MEIIKFSIEENYNFSSCAATIGAFDGLHLGHNELLKCLINSCSDCKKMVITFEKHPDYVLNKREYFGLLTTYEEKINYFKSYAIDYLVILNNDILKYSYEDFNKNVLKKLNINCVVVGSDFVYGALGEGNISTLKQDFKVVECKLKFAGNDKMSSQKVREYLQNGQVEFVKTILGHNYTIVGEVSKGAGLGKTFGFPTANIEVDETTFYMLEGVYACYVYVDERKYLSVVNVGKNPTINTQKFPRIEAFIIDFNQDIYGMKIKVEFLKMIRNERKFSSVKELIEEIDKNVEFVKKGFEL